MRSIDRALHEACRGRSAIDLQIAEGLAALCMGERLLQLGYTQVSDYGRERLGMPARSVQAAVRLGKAVEHLPLLRGALLGGRVSARKAQSILRVASGESEAGWVGLAMTLSNRALEALVRSWGGGPCDEDALWESVVFRLPRESRMKVVEAIELARTILGAATPLWRCLEAISQEYLSLAGSRGRGEEMEDCDPSELDPDTACASMREALRDAAAIAIAAAEVDPSENTSEASSGSKAPDDAFALDRWLRERVALLDRRDEKIGRLALCFRRSDGFRLLGWSSFDDYCRDRLGLSARTLRQRIWLEKRMEQLPALREAMRAQRISYSKALVLAHGHDAITIDEAIRDAEGRPCHDLQRELDAEEDRQMCARGELRLFGPPSLFELLEEALRAAQRQAIDAKQAPIGPGEALLLISEHFLTVWGPLAPRMGARRRRVFERTGGLCATPGCSRAADHLHHIRYRSRGGNDSDANLVGLCATHHMRAVHRGRVRVRGEAGRSLLWELGLWGDQVPLQVFEDAGDGA